MHQSFHLKKQQRGAALIWTLAALIVLTTLALSSSRSSVFRTRIAINDVLLGKAYQGAESALAKTLSTNSSRKFHLVDTTTNGPANAAGNKEKTFPEVITDSIATQTTVELVNTGDCPALDEIAMSTEMSGDAGGVHCQFFKVTGTSRIIGSDGAVDTHIAGVIQFIPNTATTDD
ncbi:MAG: PilX N-terminal domain-containing pilus assembly protein [Thiotrichaceae bacterium]